jgi:hypothetical protein
MSLRLLPLHIAPTARCSALGGDKSKKQLLV